jgi:serine/threonine protein kinase
MHDATMTAPSELGSVTHVTCPRCSGERGTTCVCTPHDPLPGDAELIHALSEALGPQYVVVRRLAQGGFSDVFEICDIELDRRLAVKVLRPDVAWTHGMRARFKQEARAIAKLNHQHTVPIHFVGDSEGLVFYVMSFVEGPTLADLLLAQGPLNPHTLVPMVLPVLEALEHAHAHGIIHRDIKPDNVLIEEATGRPLLLDFGIAKCLDGISTHTQVGFVVGTPLYMSPEQALGRDTVDARADLYAFGAMLFQLLTGAPPYEGKTSQEIVGRHLSEPVPDASVRNPRVPAWLTQVIRRCMAKDPADRYPSAGHVMEALRTGLATMPPPATGSRATSKPSASEPIPPELAIVKRLPRGRLWMVAAAVLLVVVAGAAMSRPGTPVTYVVANHLLSPVWVTLADGRQQLVDPGDSLRLQWPAGRELVANWSIVRPVSANGKALGEELKGSFKDSDPSGVVRHAIDVSAAGSEVYFAPRVTNAAGVSLRVAVEPRPGQQLCDCDVPSDASPTWLGYYRLLPGTTVRVQDAAGREAVFDGLDARLQPGSGLVALRVEKRDLPALARAPERTNARTRSNSYASRVPVSVPEPVIEQPVATVEPEPVVVAPVPEPVVEAPPPPPEKKQVQRSTSPVSGFLPAR